MEKRRNMLIWKMFLFRAINAFSSSIYVAYFKVIVEGSCANNDCVHELRELLAGVFLTYTFLTVWVDLCLPYIRFRLFLLRDDGVIASSQTGAAPPRQRSFVEFQVNMQEYDWKCSIEDYMAVIT